MTGVQTIGIVGGGQLGRMLTLAAKPLGLRVVVLDSSSNCPAAQVGAEVIVGNLYDKKALHKLATKCGVITIEIEHLDADVLAAIEKEGKPVHPKPSTIALIQNKYEQKVRLAKHKIPVAEFVDVPTKAVANSALEKFGGSMILKAKHGAYDGRGNAVAHNIEELEQAWEALGGTSLYAEKLVPFAKELSVIIARDRTGNVATYDTVETVHERNICLEVTAPAQISRTANQNAQKLAQTTSEILEGAGVFAIEMFLLQDNSVLVNEIAPRVHNSGHHTIEACVTSQFEQHIRAVTGMPLGDTRLISPAVMVNILGTSNQNDSFTFKEALSIANTHVHWYGKSPVKIDRKMGHITALSDIVETATKNANEARRSIEV